MSIWGPILAVAVLLAAILFVGAGMYLSRPGKSGGEE